MDQNRINMTKNMLLENLNTLSEIIRNADFLQEDRAVIQAAEFIERAILILQPNNLIENILNGRIGGEGNFNNQRGGLRQGLPRNPFGNRGESRGRPPNVRPPRSNNVPLAQNLYMNNGVGGGINYGAGGGINNGAGGGINYGAGGGINNGVGGGINNGVGGGNNNVGGRVMQHQPNSRNVSPAPNRPPPVHSNASSIPPPQRSLRSNSPQNNFNPQGRLAVPNPNVTGPAVIHTNGNLRNQIVLPCPLCAIRINADLSFQISRDEQDRAMVPDTDVTVRVHFGPEMVLSNLAQIGRKLVYRCPGCNEHLLLRIDLDTDEQRPNGPRYRLAVSFEAYIHRQNEEGGQGQGQGNNSSSDSSVLSLGRINLPSFVFHSSNASPVPPQWESLSENSGPIFLPLPLQCPYCEGNVNGALDLNIINGRNMDLADMYLGLIFEDNRPVHVLENGQHVFHCPHCDRILDIHTEFNVEARDQDNIYGLVVELRRRINNVPQVNC